MRAVDTNVLVRILVQDDRDQMAAAERFVSRGAWVSHVVLAEAVWVLEITYGRTRHQIATIVEGLLSHGELVIQDPEVIHDALANFRKYGGTDFADCLILELARRAGHLPLGTFDKRLAKVEGAERL